MLVMVGVAIVGGVVLFYGQSYDVRGVESDILNYQLRKCILSGVDVQEVEKVEKECLVAARELASMGLLARVCIDSSDCAGEQEERKILLSEGRNFRACSLEGGKSNSGYPRCVERRLQFRGKEYLVLTGSNQKLRQVGA